MSKPVILLLDKDATHLKQLFDTFDNQGQFTIMSASNLNFLKKILQKKKIDILCLDWQTATEDQESFLKKIKNNPHFKSIPLFFFTEKETYRVNEPLMRMYSDHIWSKPVSFSDISPVVQAFFSQKEQQSSSLTNPLSVASIVDESESKGWVEIEQEIIHQKTILDLQKEKILQEQNKLMRLRRKLRAEWKQLEQEKNDLREQQEAFTAEENTLFEQQIAFQEEYNAFIKEKTHWEEVKKNIEREKNLLLQQQEKINTSSI